MNNINEENHRTENEVLRHHNNFFWSIVVGFASVYLALIMAMLVADFQFTSVADLGSLFSDNQVRYSIFLSLVSSTISATIAVWFAVPIGYWLARTNQDKNRKLGFWLRNFIIVILDIPIVLPPIVVGISLLILFQTSVGRAIDDATAVALQSLGYTGINGISYEIPAVILAQFTVVTAFAIRTMRRCFEQIDNRPEKIALTLGASDYQVFSKIAFPQSVGGIVAAFSLAWARALGEFGPILIFAGTTRMKTEVMPTTIYLSFQSGDLKSAVSTSIILVSLALVILLIVRFSAVSRSME